jgi:hypothetical protein
VPIITCEPNLQQALKVVAILSAFEKTRAKIGNVNPITSWLRRRIEAAQDDSAWDALLAQVGADGVLR